MHIESAIIIAAIVLGVTHTVAPDHWMPFAAVARARGWGTSKALKVTAMGGIGHVSTSIVLSAIAIAVGAWVAGVLENFEDIFAGTLLMGFGMVYALISLRGHTHSHGHSHSHTHDHSHAHGDRYGHFLVVLASVSPCVPFIPVMLAAVPYGAMTVAMATVLFALSTVLLMVALVFAALTSARQLSISPRRERHLNVAAGLIIALLGVGVLFFGL